VVLQNYGWSKNRRIPPKKNQTAPVNDALMISVAHEQGSSDEIYGIEH
jgi:hypothetical protein